ncbi:MAG: DUF2892 domain-containing protein [candidate division Zixibacteria bacterium]|nr:DUF2892 domain-containing protein [candidate division Zixibacteria bacterium]
MSLENSIRLLAGTLVLLSLALYYFVSPWWLLLTAFVGFNLVQSSLTGFCPAEIILKKLFFGSNRGTGSKSSPEPSR